MKTAYESTREEQLRRKLELYLGSGRDWLSKYRIWCRSTDVSETLAFEEHNIRLFVKQQREAVPCR